MHYLAVLPLYLLMQWLLQVGYMVAVLTVAIGLLNKQPRSCLCLSGNIGEVVSSALRRC